MGQNQRDRGFSLIELMITVAIIGLLAAIAVPQYVRFSNRAKRTEGILQIKAIHTAQLSYYAAESVYLNASDSDLFRTLGLFQEYRPKYYMILFSQSWAEPVTKQAYYAVTRGNIDDDVEADWICIQYPVKWWTFLGPANPPIGEPYLWYDDITNVMNP